MKTNYLLPNKYKKFGWMLFLLGIIIGVFLQIFDSTDDIFNLDLINNFGFEFLRFCCYPCYHCRFALAR